MAALHIRDVSEDVAEALDAAVYTRDAQLDSDAHRAEVRVFPRTD